jgi:DNA-binding Xre family transcriptional regulator
MVRLNLRALLRAKGMTAYRLAKETALSLNAIYRLTGNRTARIELETIDRLCTALDVTPGELFTRGAGKGRA